MTSTRRAQLLFSLAPPASLAMILWAGLRAARAEAALDAAVDRHRSITAAAAELRVLTSAAPTVATSAKAQTNISGQVTDALVEAGLAPSLLTTLSPESDSSLPTPANAPAAATYRRQAARLTLEPITMPDLGRFLNAWRRQQPQWTVASINVTPASGPISKPRRSTNATPEPQAEPEPASPTRPVRAALVIECVYLEQPTSSASQQ